MIPTYSIITYILVSRHLLQIFLKMGRMSSSLRDSGFAGDFGSGTHLDVARQVLGQWDMGHMARDSNALGLKFRRCTTNIKLLVRLGSSYYSFTGVVVRSL